MFVRKALAASQYVVVVLALLAMAFSGCQSTATIPPTVGEVEIKGRVCQYKEDWLELGDRLFLRTTEFNRLGLPVGTRVTLAITVNGTSRQVSDLILDHAGGMVECTFRLNKHTRKALGVDGDVQILKVDDRPIRSFQIVTEP